MIKTSGIERLNLLLNSRRLTYAWIAGGGLWLAWLISVSLGPGNMDLAGQVVGTDYLQFHTAGMTIRLGESSRLYDIGYQAQLELDIAGPGLVNYHAFITPPFFAYLFVPLSYLHYPVSFVMWSLIGMACLFLSIKIYNLSYPLKTMAWSMTFFPVFAAISFGQNSLLSLLIFSLTYILWRKKYDFAAGLVSSFILYKPQLIVGLAILWLLEWRRDWKLLAGLASGAICLAALSLITMPEASRTYINLSQNLLPTMMGNEEFPIWHAHTWRAFWYLLFPENISLAEIIGMVFSAIGILSFFIFWKNHRSQENILFAGAIWLTLWFSPHAMVYDWAILLIPALILWNSEIHLRHVWKPIFALLWITFFLSGPLTSIQLKSLPVAIQISLPVFGVASYIIIKTLHDSSKLKEDQITR